MDPITLSNPVGDMRDDIQSKFAERPREDRGRRHTVNIVITVHVHGFPQFLCTQNLPNRGLAIRKQHGIVEVFERGLEELVRLFGLGQSSVGKNDGEKRVDAEAGLQARGD